VLCVRIVRIGVSLTCGKHYMTITFHSKGWIWPIDLV